MEIRACREANVLLLMSPSCRAQDTIHRFAFFDDKDDILLFVVDRRKLIEIKRVTAGKERRRPLRR
ncbi:MAG: hypothetical protein ACLVJ6_12580 [Merdibacter sp.]